MKKKLILFISTLKFGGMERVVLLINKLLKDTYDIKIVTIYETTADYDIDFEVYNLNIPPREGKISKIIDTVKRVKAFRKMKSKLKPDVIISFGMYCNYLNAISKNDDTKVIISIRSYDWFTKPLLTNTLDKCIVKRADSINSVSKVIAKGAEKYWNISINKNRVIYNPYNISEIKNQSLEVIDDANFDNEMFNIVSVGRLVDQKGFNHLIKAFSLVLKDNPNTQLFIIGNGEKRQKLQNLIHNLKLKDKVHLLGGKKNPYKYMKRADLYVLSSLNEGFPNAMVEAMCVGTPILATDCKSGPREILSLQDYNKVATDIELCDYGVLIPKMSGSLNYNADIIEACDIKLAEGIKYMIKDRYIRHKLSESGKERVEQFSYEKFKVNLIDEIESTFS